MASIIVDLTISLDGFVAGPDDRKQHPLGTRGGEHIFDWYQGGREAIHGDERFRPTGADRPIVEAMFRDYGAMIFGPRTYDITNGWDGRHPFENATVVIVTHRAPTKVPDGPTRFVFTAEVADAVAKAKAAAGDKAVGISGASVAQQAIAAGLVDELHLHVAPIVLGDGRRLFDNVGDKPVRLELLSVVQGRALHQRYRVVR
jgi:dihydrofolate reductase